MLEAAPRYVKRSRAASAAQDLPVVIVNETMAQALWPTGDALGKCLRLAYAPSECAEIVGIVSNTHNFSLREQPSMQYYVPLTRRGSSAQRTMLVRGRGSVSTVASEVRRSLQELYPTLPFIEVRLLQMRVDEELRPFQVGAVLMSVFGFLALTLTSIGLFGVIAYSVSQQTREIGIRLALGASGAVIIRAIMENGLRAAAIGTLTGFSAALALSRVYLRFCTE